MALFGHKLFTNVIGLNEAVIQRVLIQHGGDRHTDRAQEGRRVILKAEAYRPRDMKDPQQATGSQGGCPEQIADSHSQRSG